MCEKLVDSVNHECVNKSSKDELKKKLELEINYREKHFSQAKRLWEYVTCYFGYSEDFPDVRILFFHAESWNKHIEISEFKQMNEFEKGQSKLESFNKKDVDAQVIYRDPYKVLNIPMDKGTEQLLDGHRFVILLGEIMTPFKKEFLLEGYSLENYFEYLLIHEFIHILEQLKGRQLLISKVQDINIFRLYYGKKLRDCHLPNFSPFMVHNKLR